MGGRLVIDVPDDDSSIESDARDDGFHQGHERRRPANDRYDNLQNRGKEYPSPNDGKRGWNDFCTDRVSRYHHTDGFQQGHERRRPPNNDRYDNLQNRGQEYPSPNDGKRRWNDFCTDRVSRYPHNGGFQHGHERRRPANDWYDNLQNRGQEYPSLNDGKRGWNDFCTDRVSGYPHNGGFQHGHERRYPPNDWYDNLQNRGQEYPSPNDGKRGWNDFCTDRVSHYPHTDGFQQGHERRRPSNDGYFRGGQEHRSTHHDSPNDRKRGWHGDWQGSHGDRVVTRGDGIIAHDCGQRMGDNMQ
ncbi:hypothetical protein MHU86_5082 [Fragilaria crotonensis]|nr:hypothetical protein MHU86_5082 [Fragilaria crotonensis]